MIYVLVDRNTGKVVDSTTHHPTREDLNHPDVQYQNRNDWKDMATVTRIAAELTELTGELHLPTDATRSTSPRYDVIKAPQVGDEVSGEFNGDSYPQGRILRISGSYRRIETDTGKVFWRVLQTGSWRAEKTWYLTPGHTYKQNPSF